MGNFLVIAAAEAEKAQAERIFQRGLLGAKALKQQSPSQTASSSWFQAASFPRQNGSGSPLVHDPLTGSWLLAVGTWFHADGLAPGSEGQLLERYLQAGAMPLANQLAGFFCVVIGDARTKEVIVITDIAGSRHAFLRALPSGIALSGSSLLLAGLAGRSLDATACQEFIHTGIIYQDRTLYKEVRKLPPASVLWLADGMLKKQQSYWNASQLSPESLDDDAAVSRLWESLTQPAQQISRAFPQPVCDLTGGYDSRAAVAAFLGAGTKFTTTVSGPPGIPDVTVSQGLADVLGLPHLRQYSEGPQPFSAVKQALWFTDGEYDLVEYSRILQVHRALSQKFDISINGSFGELARGYWWELLVPRVGSRRKLDAAKLARMRYVPGTVSAELFPPEIRLQLVPHFTHIIEQVNAGLFSTPNTFQMDNAYLRMRMQRWQGRIASSTDQLWPCLSIFMYRPVLEIMLQARASLRTRSLMIRKMFARFQPALAEFPLEHGYPAAPVTWRNLHRFRPLLGYYFGKVLQRAGLKRDSSGAGSNDARLQRLKLWEEEEVRELLNPADMKAASLLHRTKLGQFLTQSASSQFAADGEWRRLLSLEYTLRQLDTLPHS